MMPSFIAEISSNHNQDMERCLAFVDTARRIGCNAVKFQLFRVTDLFAPEILAKSTLHRSRAAWELPPHFLPAIAAHCRDTGMAFGCTPFSLDGVETLAGVADFLKIASYELLWTDLLVACARTGLPVILSTGMADLAETGAAVDTLRAAGCNELILLHCVSAYPLPPDQANLAAIETLRQRFGCAVGWSDHSRQPGVVQRAVHRFGAQVVEFHLDIDGGGAEFAPGHCWLPEEMAAVIRDTAMGLAADGDGQKTASPDERADRDWRADPVDGWRPLRSTRTLFRGDAPGREHSWISTPK
jgi:N-acetylneuraminate synthase